MGLAAPRRRAGLDPVSELAKRVTTALLLVPLVVWGVLALPTAYFGLALAAFVLAGAWEWADLCGYRRTAGVAYVLALIAVLAVLGKFVASPTAALMIFAAALLWWLGALIWVIRYQAGGVTPWMDLKAVRIFVGLLVLAPAWAAMLALHGTAGGGAEWVLLLLVLVWGADTGAYFAGRRFGKTKLASRVSPGKTVEGVVGGVLLAGCLTAGYALIRPQTAGPAAGLFALGIVTALASVLGDLTESLVKRRAGRKDSGVLIPGHGGVLDRIDSLTAAAPVFALGVVLLGRTH
jgi:phosphatidate cytidylyltransferase